MTDDTRLHRLFNRARLADREVNELIGLTHGIIADGMVTKDEVDYLVDALARIVSDRWSRPS